MVRNSAFYYSGSVGCVGCVGILGNFLLGDLWELSGFAYTPYTPYTFLFFPKEKCKDKNHFENLTSKKGMKFSMKSRYKAHTSSLQTRSYKSLLKIHFHMAKTLRFIRVSTQLQRIKLSGFYLKWYQLA